MSSSTSPEPRRLPLSTAPSARPSDRPYNLSPLQRRKLARLFALYDQDCDGLVWRSDFLRCAESISAHCRQEYRSCDHRQLHDTFLRRWRAARLAAGVAIGSSVSLEQWLAGHAHMCASLQARKAAACRLLEESYVIHRLVEPDIDVGLTSLRRFQAERLGYGIAERESEQLFRLLDDDGDGFLTHADSVQLLIEFFGDDPGAVGNWFYGRC